MALTPHHAKYFARQAPALEQKLTGQKLIRALGSQRNAKRKSLFEAQDAVDQRRETLITQIEAKLTQNTRSTPVLPFRRELL